MLYKQNVIPDVVVSWPYLKWKSLISLIRHENGYFVQIFQT